MKKSKRIDTGGRADRKTLLDETARAVLIAIMTCDPVQRSRVDKALWCREAYEWAACMIDEKRQREGAA